MSHASARDRTPLIGRAGNLTHCHEALREMCGFKGGKLFMGVPQGGRR